MGVTTKIDWADHTWSPWHGCAHALLPDGSEAPECLNCYAAAMAPRNPGVLGIWGQDGRRVMRADKSWDEVRRWNAAAQKAGVRQTVFPSICDPFEDWLGPVHHHSGAVLMRSSGGYVLGTLDDDPRKRVTLDDLRRDLFRLIDETPWLTWILVTKRPQNVLKFWPKRSDCTWRRNDVCRLAEARPQVICPDDECDIETGVREYLYRPNVWLLTSAGTQQAADAFVPELLKCRSLAPVLGVSAEPLLEEVEFGHLWWVGDSGDTEEMRDRSRCGLDWVIVGGESGHQARPMHPDWARSLRDQCQAAGVAFFFKQWGEWAPIEKHVVMVPASEGGNYGHLPNGERVNEQDKRPLHVWHYKELGHVNDDSFSSLKVGKHEAGRILDGRTWDEMPEVRYG